MHGHFAMYMAIITKSVLCSHLQSIYHGRNMVIGLNIYGHIYCKKFIVFAYLLNLFAVEILICLPL
jgi:hypothetical protein